MTMSQAQNTKNTMIESDDFFMFTLTKTREYLIFVQNTDLIVEYQTTINNLIKKKAALEEINSKIIKKAEQSIESE